MMPTTRRATQMPVMVSTRFWYSSSASRNGQKQKRSQHGGWLGKEHTVNSWHATNHCTDAHSNTETQPPHFRQTHYRLQGEQDYTISS